MTLEPVALQGLFLAVGSGYLIFWETIRVSEDVICFSWEHSFDGFCSKGFEPLIPAAFI